MLRSMRGNSKGLVVSGLMPKAATIGEIRLGAVPRVCFHVVPRQYQTDRYRPHSCPVGNLPLFPTPDIDWKIYESGR